MYGLTDDPASQEIIGLGKQIMDLKAKIRELEKARPKREVPLHPLTNWAGETVTLADCFGDKKSLVVVHNMGFSCPYCTMWADGFNGLLAHIESRMAFVVVSPDGIEQQKQGCEARGWKLTMLSAKGSEFTKALGFATDTHVMPGCSTFGRTDDGEVFLHSQAPFGPGDDFCSVWSFVDLLPPA